MTWSVDRLNGLFRSVWNAFDPRNERSSRMARIACIVRLNVVTLQRTSEVLGMKTSGIDLENGLWQVRAPLRSAVHLLPLTPLASSLIRTALALRDGDGEWLFHDRRTIARASLGREFGKRMRALTGEDIVIHDLRHAGRMLLVAPPMRLPTTSVGNIFGHYHDHLELLAERANPSHPVAMEDKRRTLQIWETRLGEITNDAQSDHTVPTWPAR